MINVGACFRSLPHFLLSCSVLFFLPTHLSIFLFTHKSGSHEGCIRTCDLSTRDMVLDSAVARADPENHLLHLLIPSELSPYTHTCTHAVCNAHSFCMQEGTHVYTYLKTCSFCFIHAGTFCETPLLSRLWGGGAWVKGS